MQSWDEGMVPREGSCVGRGTYARVWCEGRESERLSTCMMSSWAQRQFASAMRSVCPQRISASLWEGTSAHHQEPQTALGFSEGLSARWAGISPLLDSQSASCTSPRPHPPAPPTSAPRPTASCSGGPEGAGAGSWQRPQPTPYKA